MKYNIYRVHPKGHKAYNCDIPTDSLNDTRTELKHLYDTDSVLLSYETEEVYNPKPQIK